MTNISSSYRSVIWPHKKYDNYQFTSLTLTFWKRKKKCFKEKQNLIIKNAWTDWKKRSKGLVIVRLVKECRKQMR